MATTTIHLFPSKPYYTLFELPGQPFVTITHGLPNQNHSVLTYVLHKDISYITRYWCTIIPHQKQTGIAHTHMKQIQQSQLFHTLVHSFPFCCSINYRTMSLLTFQNDNTLPQTYAKSFSELQSQSINLFYQLSQYLCS